MLIDFIPHTTTIIMRNLVLFLLLFVIFCACEEEYLIITEIEEENTNSTTELVTANLQGNILTIDAAPIKTADIGLSVRGKSFGMTSTDEEGQFLFDAQMVNQENNLLTIMHPIYGSSYHTIALTEDRDHYTQINMTTPRINEVSGLNNLVYEDELISFAISNKQFDQNTNHSIQVKSYSTKHLNNLILLPQAVAKSGGTGTYLQHFITFQINAFDDNVVPSKINPDESLDITILNNVRISDYEVWMLNTEEGVWQNVDQDVVINDNLLTISELGLYSLTIPESAILINQRITDENGQGIPFAKVEITLAEGAIVDQVFTDSEGYIQTSIPEDFRGEVKISKVGYPDLVIDVPSTSEFAMAELSLSTSAKCLDRMVEISADEGNECFYVVQPSALIDRDITGGLIFTLAIADTIYEVANSQETFIINHTGDFGTESISYLLTYADQDGTGRSCTGTIQIIDTTPPVVACTEQISVSLDDSNELIIFPNDIYFEANPVSCDLQLDLKIARIALCTGDNGTCEDADYKTQLTFKEEDVGVEIGINLRVTDVHGNRDMCSSTLLINK